MVSKDIFKVVFESFPEGCILTDKARKILLVNRKAESLLVKTSRDLDGITIEEALGIDKDKGANDYFLECLNSPVNSKNESAIQFKHASSVTFKISWQIISNNNEECICFLIKDIVDNLKKDEQLLESNIRLSEIYKIANIGIWEWDKETDTVIWSEEVYKIKGVDSSLPAYPFSEQAQFYTPDSWKLLQGAVFNTLSTGEPYELQIDYVRLDGSIRNAIVHGGCKKDSQGNIIGLYGTVQDITDKKTEELLVLENESNLKAIIENTTDNIWAINKNKEIIYLNEVFRAGFFRDWGIRLEKGVNILEVIPSYIKESWNNNFNEVFANKRLEYEDEILIGGKQVYFNVALNPIVLNGDVVGISVFTSDISERKRIENALRESEAHLSELVNATIEGIVISKNGIVVNANKPVSELLGYTQEELIGKSILDFVTKELQEKVSRNITEGISEVYEHLVIKKDGTLIPVEIHGKAIIDKSNERVRFTAIRDISARKKIELEIKKQNFILQIQNKELEQFAYVTSHDLQEPLRTLISISELLSTEFKEENNDQVRIDKYLEYIIESANRMQLLVKGLLDFSRIGKEKEASSVDCNKIVDSVLTDLEFSIANSNAKITIGELPILKAYSIELRLLFQNLISNAIKFRKKETPLEIEIHVTKQNGEYLFSVKDNGIGIDKNDFDKIFVIFKRLHNRKEYEGTGIGLSHCKKIIELHEGTIWVESELGIGTVFYFVIPVL